MSDLEKIVRQLVTVDYDQHTTIQLGKGHVATVCRNLHMPNGLEWSYITARDKRWNGAKSFDETLKALVRAANRVSASTPEQRDSWA